MGLAHCLAAFNYILGLCVPYFHVFLATIKNK